MFRDFIRERDHWTCQYDGCGVRGNQVQCAHYVGRIVSGTRYTPANATTFCPRHHFLTEDAKQFFMRQHMLDRFGQAAYDEVRERWEAFRRGHGMKRKAAIEEWQAHCESLTSASINASIKA